MNKQHSMWGVFGMDRKKEVDGFVVQYPGNIRLTLARAGGGNSQFATAHEIHMRPFRAAQNMKQALPDATQRKLIIKVYLDSVIRKFETNVSTDPDQEDWQPVIVWPEGDVTPADKPHLEQLLTMLPDLLDEIIKDSTSLANYRKEQLDADAGN